MGRRHTISAALRNKVISTYGNQCWLCLPGCTKVGQEDDHIVPYAHGGKDTLGNIRRACKHCNASRQDRVLNGYGVDMHIVLSPPGACDVEALQYVYGNMGHNDILIAFSEIAKALNINTDDVAQRRIAAYATDSAYRQAARTPSPTIVWHIRTIPKSQRHPHMLDEWIALDYNIHVVDPGFRIAYDRAPNNKYKELVRQWYALHLSQDHIDSLQAKRRETLTRLGLRSAIINAQEPVW